ncbi:MAG TPA: hypothetical protein VFF69_15855, partial [Phycisphaerales bacterium]|nr:hypothetical protein [Phycisphaerales bacterium]
MLKVLRKYNKMILVVGGTLLLISFLVPQAIQQLGQARMGRAVGSMDGRKISAADFDEAQRQLSALREFFARVGGRLPIPLADGHEIEHWLLLRHEAERAGMIGGVNEGASLLPLIAQELAVGAIRSQYGQFAEFVLQSQPDHVQQLVQNAQTALASARNTAAGATRMTYDEFDQALATFRGIRRLLEAYGTAERISDRQAITIAKGLADSVLVDAAFLNARELSDPALEPTPEELQAHFERFKEVQPAGGEFGIGYRLPPRVKLAWLGLDRPAIRGAITIPMLDQTKHYHQNRDRFPGEFEAEREKVEGELRDQKTDRIMRAAEAVVASEILRATRPLEKSGEYLVVPDDWASRRPNFVTVAEHVVASVEKSEGVRIPTPTVHVLDGAWLDA